MPHAFDETVRTAVLGHMNADHRDALVRIVDAFLDVPDEVLDAEMLSCDRYGVEVRLTVAASDPARPGVAFGRIGFASPLQAADGARAAMVALVRRARITGAG